MSPGPLLSPGPAGLQPQQLQLILQLLISWDLINGGVGRAVNNSKNNRSGSSIVIVVVVIVNY